MKLRGYLYVACALAAVGLLLGVPGCAWSGSSDSSGVLSLREAVTVGNSERNPADPYLKLAPSGEILASWTEQEPGNEDDGRNFFIAAVSQDGSGMGRPRQINAEPGELSGHGGENLAKFTLNKDGGVAAVWMSPLSEYHTGVLRVAHGAQGESFRSAGTLNDDQEPVNHAFSAIATSPNGKVYATWMDGRNRKVMGMDNSDPQKGPKKIYAEDNSQLMMAVSEDGGKTFGKNYPITDFSVCNCCRPTIVFLDGGETVVVSYRRVAKEFLRDQVVIRSTDGGKTFGEPVYISDDGWVAKFCPHSGVSIATDSRQRIHAVWWTGGRTEEEAGIYYTYSADGGKSFAPRQLIEKTQGKRVMHALVSLDRNDGLWITWENMRDEKIQVFLAHRRPGSTGWSSHYQLSDGTRTAGFPVVISDGKTLYTAWTEREGESSQVKMRTAKLG